MPTFKRKIASPPAKEIESESLKSGVTYVYHWTRQEQIDNAAADGTLDEMRPPLKGSESPS